MCSLVAPCIGPGPALLRPVLGATRGFTTDCREEAWDEAIPVRVTRLGPQKAFRLESERSEGPPPQTREFSVASKLIVLVGHDGT